MIHPSQHDAGDVIDREIELQGNGAAFFDCRDQEVLCESGAGTGKSFSLMVKANWTAREYPECRQLFLRQTRKSLTESILPDWEHEILWPGHPAIHGTASREHRDSYRYPNGSIIVLGGCDKIDRILSSKWDRIYIFQCEEVTLETWEKLISRLRAFQTPYHQIIADVNPAPPTHWLARKFGRSKGAWHPNEDKAVFSYRHDDNPLLYDADTGQRTPKGEIYIEKTLNALTGVRRERLLKHRWVAAEGMVWEDYDPEVHLITGEIKKREQDETLWLHVVGWDEPVKLEWFMGSMDIGFEEPGCFQVWGVDRHNCMYRVAEVYRRHWDNGQWADAICDLHSEFRMRAISCDHDPAFIKLLNDRISGPGGNEMHRIARPADKTRDKGEKAGIDQVRVRMKRGKDGKRGIYLMRDALRCGADPELMAEARPVCTEQEIPGYVYRVMEDGKPYREEPEPTCIDHGCDALRYAAVWIWKRDFTVTPEPEGYKPGTYGAELFDGRWDEILSGRHKYRKNGRSRRKVRR